MIEGDPSANTHRSSYPRLKVLYLLAVTVLVFVVPACDATRPMRWIVVPALVSLQVVLLLLAKVSALDIVRVASRLKWLFVFLIACYLFLPDPTGDAVIYYWTPLHFTSAIPVNLSGFETAGLMCLQILTVVMVSAVVRLTGSSADLVEGLRKFRLPHLLALSIDTTLALIGGVSRRGMGGGGSGGGGGGGRGRGGGGGGGRGRRAEAAIGGVPGGSLGDHPVEGNPSPVAAFKRMLRGDVGFFVQAIQRGMTRAQEQLAQADIHGLDQRLVHDVSVISGIALTMMTLKMLKVLPGLPFIPGWKTVFFYPLYILAAQLTYSRWGGTTAGAIMGVLGYLQGDGRYGALEILKHIMPGLVTDVAWPVVGRLPRSLILYCFLGLVTAIARTSTEFAVMWLIQVRWEAYAFPLMIVSTNLIAGTISGVLTYFVLPAFQRMQLVPSENAQPEAVAGAVMITEPLTHTSDSPVNGAPVVMASEPGVSQRDDHDFHST